MEVDIGRHFLVNFAIEEDSRRFSSSLSFRFLIFYAPLASFLTATSLKFSSFGRPILNLINGLI